MLNDHLLVGRLFKPFFLLLIVAAAHYVVSLF